MVRKYYKAFLNLARGVYPYSTEVFTHVYLRAESRYIAFFSEPRGEINNRTKKQTSENANTDETEHVRRLSESALAQPPSRCIASSITRVLVGPFNTLVTVLTEVMSATRDQTPRDYLPGRSDEPWHGGEGCPGDGG